MSECVCEGYHSELKNNNNSGSRGGKERGRFLPRMTSMGCLECGRGLSYFRLRIVNGAVKLTPVGQP